MKASQHPLFGRIYLFVMCVAILLIGIPIFFSLKHFVWSNDFIAYVFLLVLIGLILYYLAMLIFAEDLDIQLWMDEHVFHEPVYFHHLIFHFVFFVSLLFFTHLIFIFFRLFLETDHR